MQISPTDERELLTVMHEGMHEQPVWGVFLSRLRRIWLLIDNLKRHIDFRCRQQPAIGALARTRQ